MKDIDRMEINLVILKNKMTLHNSGRFPLKLHSLGVLEEYPGGANLYPFESIEKITFTD